MKYEIVYHPLFVKNQIPKLAVNYRACIKTAIEKKLAIDPLTYGKPLKYSLKGLRRLRVGDYRVVFKIDENAKRVIMIQIAHRKEVYE